MFTRDRFQTDPNGSGPIFVPDRPSVYAGPFWNRSGTDPNRSKTGPAVLQVQFWIRPRQVPNGSMQTPGSVPNGST